MKVNVNGSMHELAASTLAAALEELGYRSRALATALNGEFIAASERPGAVLADGDRIDIVAPMQGG